MSGSRSDARRPAGGAGGCAIHLVRFAAYGEGGCPVAGGGGLAATMADMLVALGPGGCGREVATPGFGQEQVALPVEDVIATSNHTLFDQDGYLTRVCAMHAEFLRLHAVAPRACQGPQCRNRAAPGLAQARRVSGVDAGVASAVAAPSSGLAHTLCECRAQPGCIKPGTASSTSNDTAAGCRTRCSTTCGRARASRVCRQRWRTSSSSSTRTCKCA